MKNEVTKAQKFFDEFLRFRPFPVTPKVKRVLIPNILVSRALIGLEETKQQSLWFAAAKEMTTEGTFVQAAIPRFDGHYDHWNMLMEIFLRSKEYWSLVETGYEEPASGVTLTDAQQKRLDELKLKDLKVKNYLFQAIDRTILETILQKDTSKQIWDSMKKKYEGNARVKRSILQALRKEFEILEMKSWSLTCTECQS